MFDFPNPNTPPVNDRDLEKLKREMLGQLMKSMVEDIANDPAKPETLRLKAKISLESTDLANYITENAKGYACSDKIGPDADPQPLRDVLDYLRLVRAGAETFFETHKPENI